jgi:hypothetical protein
VPDKVAAFLGGAAASAPARFRLRVLSGRFSRHFTSRKLSPLVSRKAGTPTTAGTYLACQQSAVIKPATDADGDGLPSGIELAYGLDPCTADTDGDGVTDGYEYWSAVDLNGAAYPFPGKAPYANPLDGSDADIDFDSDGLTLMMEFQAWSYMGRPLPLSYSDGNPYTGGTALRDGNKDVDGDGLTNFQETTGPMQIKWWQTVFDGNNAPLETPYPNVDHRFVQPSFVDPDTDGDGLLDGNDDQDHDGYPNWFEVSRPADWLTDYTSTVHPWHSGSPARENPLARVNPYNPCKPIYSAACHNPSPLGYYGVDEDWASDVTPSTAPPMGTSPGTHA